MLERGIQIQPQRIQKDIFVKIVRQPVGRLAGNPLRGRTAFYGGLVKNSNYNMIGCIGLLLTRFQQRSPDAQTLSKRL